MCGICGIFEGENSREAVGRMVAALRHRGPDDSGAYASNAASIGMSRLAIIDVTHAGHQPMANPEETVWIVYNGETYNFREERLALERLGYRFDSHSDTEVVLNLYLHYGDGFLSRLNGIFALAILDMRKGRHLPRLLLARDPLGVKPLLYANTPGGLVFASEMKAILASGLVEKHIDADSLFFFLGYGSVPQPRTILSEVKMLMPGEFMVVESGLERIQRYFTLGEGAQSRGPGDYQECVAVLRGALEAAIARQIVSDVPVGAFLSGGIDSSALVGLMSRRGGARIKTFSVGFGSEGADLDETDDAARVAASMGTEHRRIELSGSELNKILPGFAKAIDQPSVDGLNTWAVSRVAAEEVKVAISGTGGDELFAGYPWFGSVASSVASAPGWGPGLIRAAAAGISRVPPRLVPTGFSERVWGRLASFSGVPAAFGRQIQVTNLPTAYRLLAPNMRTCLAASPGDIFSLADRGTSGQQGQVARISELCIRTYLQNQLLRDIDAVSMHCSLEVRVPFLDLEVVKMAMSLPDSVKLTHPEVAGERGSYAASGAKRVLIDAVRELLPEGFDRQPKRGFSIPMTQWLRGPLAQWKRELLAPESVRRRGVFDVAGIQNLLKAFDAEKAAWPQIWIPMIFELWCREVLDA